MPHLYRTGPILSVGWCVAATQPRNRMGSKEQPMATSAEMPGPGPTGKSHAERRRSNREMARLVGAAIALALLVAFVLDNSQSVTVGFVFFSTRLSLIWVLIIAAVLGAATDRLVILLRARRKAKRSTHPS